MSPRRPVKSLNQISLQGLRAFVLDSVSKVSRRIVYYLEEKEDEEEERKRVSNGEEEEEDWRRKALAAFIGNFGELVMGSIPASLVDSAVKEVTFRLFGFLLCSDLYFFPLFQILAGIESCAAERRSSGKMEDDNKYMSKFTREMCCIVEFTSIIVSSRVVHLDLGQVVKMLRFIEEKRIFEPMSNSPILEETLFAETLQYAK